MEDYKEETIRTYDKSAEELSERFKTLMDFERRYEFGLFLKLLSGKKVLDLGSGGGDHALYFTKRGLEVLCVDLSEKMVELCKRKGLNAEVMDIENLTFADKSFDGIWAVTSMLHVPKSKWPAVIDSLYKTLNDGGVLYVCVKEGEGEGLVDDREVLHGKQLRRYYSYWSGEELLSLFKEGCELIDFRKAFDKDTCYLQAFFKKKS